MDSCHLVARRSAARSGAFRGGAADSTSIGSYPDLAVWWATPVACASAFARLRRGHVLDRDAETAAREKLHEIESLWLEIQPTADLRGEALRILDAHGLTAADALQLAAALEWAGGDPAGASLLTFDRRLGDAARREGFEVPDVGGFER